MRVEQGSSEVKEEELLVVSNSSVIIALAKVRRLNLLEKLFRKIVVPEAVWKEVVVEGKPGRKEILGAEFMYLKKASNRGLVALLEEFVDRGEAEAIALALELNADLLLIDDRDARNLAKKLGLKAMGTLGVLALAKYRGLVQEVKPIIDELVKSGFWISKKILEEFLRELGEF